MKQETINLILATSVPFIARNLASIDFLRKYAPKVDGKTPFYDDETHTKMKGNGLYGTGRTTTHLKDSWNIEYSTSGSKGYIYLSNSKMVKGTHPWNLAELLWNGTEDYKIPIGVSFSAIAGVAQTQYPFANYNRRYKPPKPGPKPMTFYSRYQGTWHYNRTSRRGMRDVFPKTFREFILVCVEDGLHKGVAHLEHMGDLTTPIANISVKIKGA